MAGSSPHARGKLARVHKFQSGVGLIPACAGKTLMGQGFVFAGQAHPRMRGENKVLEDREVLFHGSSPHARGKPGNDHAATKEYGLIPACAGKTE